MKTRIIALACFALFAVVTIGGGAFAASDPITVPAALESGLFHQSSPCNSAVMDCSGR